MNALASFDSKKTLSKTEFLGTEVSLSSEVQEIDGTHIKGPVYKKVFYCP